MLQEMKLKPLNKKQMGNLAFPLYKKNAISTTPIPQSEILSTVKEFLLFTTKDVNVVPPKIDMIKIDPIYYNTSSIPIDTTSMINQVKNNSSNNNKNNKAKKQKETVPGQGQTTSGAMMPNLSPNQQKRLLATTSTYPTTRVSLLKKQLEAISSYESLICDREKVAKALYFNIESLESKILHMKSELKKNLHHNYYTSDYTIKIAFEQDKTRTIQNQIDNELPQLRMELDQIKEHMLQIENETESISLVSSKLNTERVFVIEDIKKISKVIFEINKDRIMKEDQLSELKMNIKEIRIKAHNCAKANDKFAKEIQQLIEI